jgi:hypothetical protein
MRLCRVIGRGISQVLRSPIDPELVKSWEGRREIEKRVKGRFKEEGLVDETVKNYELFRKSRFDLSGIFTISK